MSKLILLHILLSSFVFSQNNYDFTYERIVKVDGFIVKIESYDSKTGVYYRTGCDIYGPLVEEKVTIPITEKEKSDLWELRKEFGDFVFGECTTNKNVSLISNFYFENETYPPRCIENETQKEQFINLSMSLRLLLESKPEYRKVFYWEFIKR